MPRTTPPGKLVSRPCFRSLRSRLATIANRGKTNLQPCNHARRGNTQDFPGERTRRERAAPRQEQHAADTTKWQQRVARSQIKCRIARPDQPSACQTTMQQHADDSAQTGCKFASRDQPQPYRNQESNRRGRRQDPGFPEEIRIRHLQEDSRNPAWRTIKASPARIRRRSRPARRTIRAQPVRWRSTSNSTTPVATETFKLSTLPRIGMRAMKSQFSRVSRRMPSPSLPMTTATGPLNSQA